MTQALNGFTATGTTQGDAYPVTIQQIVFTTVPPGSGARLPSPSGFDVTVVNEGANALLLYPGPGDQIGETGVNLPISVGVGASVTVFSTDNPLTAPPRTWYVSSNTGGGSGASITLQNQGTPLGTFTTLNADDTVTFTDEGAGVAGVSASGGGSSVGPAGTVQMVGSTPGSFAASNFADLLTVSGSATAELVDSTDIYSAAPGLRVGGPGGGDNDLVGVAVVPGGTVAVGGYLFVTSFGSGTDIWLATAEGTPDAPTKVVAGEIGALQFLAFDGTAYQDAGSLRATANSDFSVSATSSFDFQNASGLGWHVAADGTFSIDNVVTSPALTVLAAATITDGAQVGTLTNAPTAGNPATFIEISVNGTTYAVPAWALS